MLRDILSQTENELRAWVRQKDFEAKRLGPNETTRLFVENVGADGRSQSNGRQFDRGALPRGIAKMGGQVDNVKHLERVSETKQMTRSGGVQSIKTSTYLCADDVNGANYLAVKDKVKQLQRVQTLLSDIAGELLAGYLETRRQGPQGEFVMVMGHPDDPGARAARRTRLGLDGLTIGQHRGRGGN